MICSATLYSRGPRRTARGNAASSSLSRTSPSRPTKSTGMLRFRRRQRPPGNQPPPQIREVALLPGHEDLAGDEYRAVGARDPPYQQHQQEALDGGAAEEEQGYYGEQHRDRRVQRARHRLGEAYVHHLIEGGVRVGRRVLPDAVEDDDGVVDAEADDGDWPGEGQK